MKNLMKVVFAVAVITALSGCNTTRGFGEDVEKVGGAISRAAS